MERTLLIGFFLLASLSSVSAQPVLTAAGNFSIGQQVTYRSALATTVTPGPAGADVVWDFSDLIPDGSTLTLSIESPETTPYTNLFPGADLVEHFSTGVYQYQRVDARNDLVGFVDESQELRISYPNPWRVAKRPLAYEEHLYDTLTRAYTLSGLEFSGIGFSDLSADGYGILKLPDGSERAVVRTTIDQINYDTCDLGILTVHFRSWRWYEPNGIFPVMRIDSETIASDFFNSSRTVAMYGGAPTTGVAKTDPAMKDFQLRADKGTIRLSGEFASSAEYRLEAFSLRGSRVESWNIGEIGSGTYEVPFTLTEGATLFVLTERKGGTELRQSFILRR